MEIETKYFDNIEIEREEIITFPQGIPGFLDRKKFVLLHLNQESPFIILQSVEEKELAFITITPWDVIKSYEFEISEKAEKQLQIEKPEDVIVLTICTIKDELKNMTVNLAAPLVINYNSALGKQVIIDDSKYSVKNPVFIKKPRREAK